MSSRERLADGLYPGEGGLTGHTRVRRGPTRRFFGLPRRPAGKRRSVDCESVPEHPIRSDSDRPRSQVFHRIREDAVETLAPHLLKERGEAPVSVEELVRAVEEEVERQMPPFRLDGFEMKHRRPKG